MTSNIKTTSTNKALSLYGGLLLAKRVAHTFGIRNRLAKCVPSLKAGSSRSLNKFEAMVFGSIAGAECLDDLGVLGEDHTYQEVVEKSYTPKAYGDFLRSFTEIHCSNLQVELMKLSFEMRASLFPNNDMFVIDIDSTSNQQYGLKMEGVETNYKNIECLDTLKAFDECGLPYWHEVRPGATFTSTGASRAIKTIFSKMPKTSAFQWTQRYARADSGFCNVDFFNACKESKAYFVTPMRENMLEPRLELLTKWKRHNRKEHQRSLIHDGRECEIAETVYRPEKGQELLRIICLRAVKHKLQSVPMFEIDRYDYYAFVTNIPHSEMTPVDVINFYRKRGNAENYIKEDKYGFDLKHYPCLKLIANKAYGLITAFATAYMRFLSLIQGGKRKQYSKAIRNKLIHIPVQIVRHAREVVFKFMPHHLKEVYDVIIRLKHLHLSIATCPESRAGRSLTTE